MAVMVQQTDKRVHARKACNLPVDLDDYDSAFSGNIRNLGKGGAFIEIPVVDGPEVGRELIMTIPYRHNENYLIIKATVAWTSSKGIGVAFMKSGLMN